MASFARVFKIDHPDKIIRQCVEAVKCFRDFATKYQIDKSWQDLIESHFAEMNPDLLSELHLYKPSTYDFIIEPHDIRVENAHWEEMRNRSKRLTAKLNGTEYKATVSPKSKLGKAVTDDGGIKMSQDAIKRYVEELLLPKYLETQNTLEAPL